MPVTFHELKAHPEEFAALSTRQKLGDFRRDDRDPPYAVGDYLFIREWDPAKVAPGPDAEAPLADDGYTDSHQLMRIMYKNEGGTFGIPEGYCVLSLWPMQLISGGVGGRSS